ncbi:DNA polymerase alpha/epsilon subunit B-domain-containing protein [Mortierella sp. GBAus27b]|nr:DNA polymerase delta subunit 2 [Mortierella sp. GBA43]KAI8345700.1 DNA polymerase alpha/epsilon subunit B-domain-containing protein [Mortierella sp. GBAus27b]
MSAMESAAASIERRQATFAHPGKLQDDFVVQGRDYQQQYSHLYFMRLVLMRPMVARRAELQWGSLDSRPRHVEKVLEVRPGEVAYLVGTVYMDMKLKPNILSDLGKDYWIAAQPERPKYTDDDDSIYLEDESGRVRLSGPRITGELFVTGVVIGVLGSEDEDGNFKVVDVCYAQPPHQEPIDMMETDEADKYVALVSGLGIGGTSFKPLELDLLAEYLTGEIGNTKEQTDAANIVRTIIAGNSIIIPEATEEETRSKRSGHDKPTMDIRAPKILDGFVQEVCSSVPVDIMPGESDPSGTTMPQQPIHTALFQVAREYSTFHSVTNPYWSTIDNVTLLGTSGQTINDIYKYTTSGDRLEMAKRTLAWAHMAPTAPDTLWCYPFKDKDPFIMKQLPHIYFVGNQDKFQTDLVTGENGERTRIVMVPSFAKTGTIALVNLRTLDCRSVTFSTGTQ